jgi:hypothetical protein
MIDGRIQVTFAGRRDWKNRPRERCCQQNPENLTAEAVALGRYSKENFMLQKSQPRVHMPVSILHRAALRAVKVAASLAFVGAMSLAASSAQAATRSDSTSGMSFGAMGGMLVPNKSGTAARPGFGVHVGAQLGTEFGIGGYYLSSKKDEGGTVGQFDLDFFGIEGVYRFEGEAKGGYFGGRLGISKINVGSSATQVNMSPYHIGFIGGYDRFLTDFISIGGELGFYSIGKGESTPQSGVAVTVDSFTALSFLASVKFWL